MHDRSTPEERWLIDRFGDILPGLIHYGSTAFGEPRKGSTRDFWVIVDDLTVFHRRFTPHTIEGEDPAPVAERVRTNLDWPCFFGVENGGLVLKMAVVSKETFCRRCRALSFYVKGRMQKPVRILRADDDIRAAIDHARSEGVAWALDLLPREFTFEEFLLVLLGMSYRTEIRPEFARRKVRSIYDSGREDMEAMYRPRLEATPYVKRVGDRYIDLRPAGLKRRLRRAREREFRRMKFSREALRNIYRNYMTHSRPLLYMWQKVTGELEKLRRSRRAR